MKKSDIFLAWAGILRGRRPFLSIEITRECPLRCPGCYAYEPEHLGGGALLRQLSDLRGEALVNGVLDLAREYRPLHISIIGGEPLVRYRELGILLPKLTGQGIEVQLVTSAVRAIPSEWSSIDGLHLVVSIDGLLPEHDARRFPATYERILENIAGHRVIVHCTITRQMLQRKGYLAQFAQFWTDRPEARKIWFSFYTPQEGDCSDERLRPEDRVAAVGALAEVRRQFPKVDLPEMVLREFLKPPESPQHCIFSQMTTCFSADLHTRVSPCQFGGCPVCSECGCLASLGMASLGNLKLAGILRVGDIYAASRRFGHV